MVNGRKCLTTKMVIGIVVVLGICMGIKLVESKEEYRNKKIIVCLKKGGEFGEKYSADTFFFLLPCPLHNHKYKNNHLT